MRVRIGDLGRCEGGALLVGGGRGGKEGEVDQVKVGGGGLWLGRRGGEGGLVEGGEVLQEGKHIGYLFSFPKKECATNVRIPIYSLSVDGDFAK